VKTNREEMIKRVNACIKAGHADNDLKSLDVLAVNDPSWESKDTLVSLYMLRGIRWMREGSLSEQLHRFMLPKAAYTDDPVDRTALIALATAYAGSWDEKSGDLDALHAFVDAFTRDQLAAIGI